MLYIDRMPVTGGKFPNQEVYIDFDELHSLDKRARTRFCASSRATTI